MGFRREIEKETPFKGAERGILEKYALYYKVAIKPGVTPARSKFL